MAAVKTDDPDLLTRGVEAIRQNRGFRTEFEFGNLIRDALPAYRTWSS